MCDCDIVLFTSNDWANCHKTFFLFCHKGCDGVTAPSQVVFPFPRTVGGHGWGCVLSLGVSETRVLALLTSQVCRGGFSSVGLTQLLRSRG